MRSEERLAARLAELEEWRRDGHAAMVRWAEAVGVDERLARINPQLAVEPTDVMLRDEDITALPQDDFLWTVSHLMGFFAELLRDKHGGEWVVEEDPASPMFTDYLVASGPKRFNPGLMVKAYLESPPPRDLRHQLARADDLAARQAGLDAFRHEAARVQLEWMGTLGLDTADPLLALVPTERMLGDQDLDAFGSDQRRWLESHLLVFVGEVLRARNDGEWQIDNDPESPSYTTQVIVAQGRTVDPWRIVLDYLGTPPPRDLAEAIRRSA